MKKYVWILWVGMLAGLVQPVQAGDLINKHLPEYIKMDLEFRHRLEYRDNFDFNDSLKDEDRFDLLRSRLNFQWIPTKFFKLFTQWQDAQIANDKFANRTTFENEMDLRQLYAEGEIAVPEGFLDLKKISLRGGRQEFTYGAQRLIGGFNWSNVTQTFDGGKIGLAFNPYEIQIDFLGGEKTSIKSPKEADDLFDGSSQDAMLGYYAASKVLNGTLMENYMIHRWTKKNISFGPSGSGEVDNYTFGGRLKKAFSNGFDIELESAGQWGNFKDKGVRAMMAIVNTGYTFDHTFKPRVAFEFDYGSGDPNSSDGKLTTFDNLYPTNHLFYGYMDFISLQNLNNYMFEVSAVPHKKLKLKSALHLIFLDTPKDSLYSAGRAVTRTASAGSSGVSSHVGNEIDLLLDFKVNNYVNVHAGYSHFFAGQYLKDTGAHDDADFFYLQTTLSL